ncbi:MAG: flagellar assembly protein FliH [Gammaproteobacteria bacterium]|nr:flagellar assembly protein FliH [Gammaproteobacteria bacterium]
MSVQPGRIIARDDARTVERWALPEVGGEPGLRCGAGLATTRGKEHPHNQAYQEAFELGRRDGRERGYAEGQAAAREDVGQRLRRLKALFDALVHPFAVLDAEVERSVVELAMLVARHLVRRELRADPGEVIGVVREAIAHLPVAARNPRIRLNPDDLELVRDVLALADGEQGWRLEPDPLIARGGCLVETSTSFIDATVEARLAAIVARALGGERSGDRGT